MNIKKKNNFRGKLLDFLKIIAQSLIVYGNRYKPF